MPAIAAAGPPTEAHENLFTGKAARVDAEKESPLSLTMSTETEVSRKRVVPKLKGAGWDNEAHSIAPQVGKLVADPFDLLRHLAFNAPVLAGRQCGESRARFVMANNTRIVHSGSMKISRGGRKYTAE
jgi:hypothetical protein